MTTLFDPIHIGCIAAANRIVMAPLTRNRAGAGGVPPEMAALYYAQRASAGLIVAEATQISFEGQGYIATPGIHTPEQVSGWRGVTDAVHAAGGKIVLQLWHVGRISHVSLLPAGMVPVSSSARVAAAKTFTQDGLVDVSAPRALRTDEMPRLVADFRHAARNGMAAGFDGIEVHGANGYLLDQFLRDSINDRTDAYGGTIANRCRVVVEIMQAVVDEIGADRCGIRLSPVTPFNDCGPDSDAQGLFNHLMGQLAPMKLAFVHVIEGSTGGPRDFAPFDYDALHALYKQAHPAGTWLLNNGYDRAMALEAVASGIADAIAFGKPFISNPDLVRRLREDAPLNALDADSMFGGDAKGYIDYPTLDAVS